MASFNYGATTYGRSDAGTAKLIQDLKSDIGRAKKKLSTGDADYKAFVNTIRANWSGSDAEVFLAKFQKSVQDCAKKINDYSSKIETRINADNKGFKSMQNAISKKI